MAFAKSKGFSSVDFWEEWNGFDVFVANSDGEGIPIIGYPFFILVREGVARESETFEIYPIMQFSEVSSDFSEDLV